MVIVVVVVSSVLAVELLPIILSESNDAGKPLWKDKQIVNRLFFSRSYKRIVVPGVAGDNESIDYYER